MPSGYFSLNGQTAPFTSKTGTTTLNAGMLTLGAAEIAGTSGPLGNSVADNPGSIILNGGYLQYSDANTYDYSGRFSTAAIRPPGGNDCMSCARRAISRKPSSSENTPATQAAAHAFRST